MSNYEEEIQLIGNADIPEGDDAVMGHMFRYPRATGYSFGPFSVKWSKDTKYPHFAITASMAAAYAAEGLIEDGVTPYDLAESLLLLPAIEGPWTGAVRRICIDALSRCLCDARFVGADAANARDLLSQFIDEEDPALMISASGGSA